MKKIFCIVLIMIVVSIFGLTACSNLNNYELPDKLNFSVDDIVEIDCGTDNVITDKAQMSALIDKINESTPTFRMSVHDTPPDGPGTKVKILNSQGDESILFIYCVEASIFNGEDKWYVELPYVGVYKTDNSILDCINEK